MAWTTPALYTTNQVLTSSSLNAQLVNNDVFLFTPPSCHVGRTSSKSVSSSVDTVHDFDFEAWDTDNIHSNVTNNTRFTPPTAGKYCVVYRGTWQTDANGQRDIRAWKDGSPTGAAALFSATNPAGEWGGFATYVESFTGTTYTEVKIYQDSGSTLTFAADGAIFWIGGP